MRLPSLSLLKNTFQDENMVERERERGGERERHVYIARVSETDREISRERITYV